MCAALALAAAAAAPHSGTTPFVFDGNRMYAELVFLRPDGSTHRALAFVDLGTPAVALRESLFKDLKLDRGQPLVFTIGGFRIQVPAADVVSEPDGSGNTFRMTRSGLVLSDAHGEVGALL